MKKIFILLLACLPLAGMAQPQTDTYPTSAGNVDITLIGHGSLMIEFNNKTIYIDPYGNAGDYTKLPKADLMLITHEHGDHFDKNALEAIAKNDTYIITNQAVAELYAKTGKVLANGESTQWNGVGIEAVPAYNIVHEREPGVPFHPKGRDNGYILTFGDFRVYVAGDTEPVPEMLDLGRINVAFLPKNLPYTMTDAEFVRAARLIEPAVLYPYHYSEIDKGALREQLPGIEIK